MGIFDNAHNALLGFWLPLTILSSVIFCFFILHSRTRDTFDMRKQSSAWRFEMEKLERERFSSHDRDKSANMEIADLVRAYLESSLSQLGSRLNTSVSNNLRPTLDNLEKALFELNRIALVRSDSPIDITTIEKILRETVRSEISREPVHRRLSAEPTSDEPNVTSNTTPETLIKELSHALNTPLSRIEVITETQLPASAENSQNTAELASSLQQIRSSVEICKAYLAAFRQMVLISNQSLLWSPESLRRVVQGAFHVFCEDRESKTIKVDLPDKIPGQNNNLVFAILLPLLENAIEASPANSEIEVACQRDGPTFLIMIENEVKNPPRVLEMLTRGFTTKEGHDGLGLSIVQSLIATIPGAGLEAEAEVGKVRFKISMPLEASNAP